ncbi:hypothetical protein CDD80_2311 [Ophiocordyceps camponoti-rufipedis]|uniref:Uncharacterized protein n=1 Tax=Ophiocordyceps camponoti-rufipedis TaxID=2004952 RepID=A0A2C5Z801_9HYPO|nr:hypothetical protein CDD80_2311 [Ophiocordyceps camponoti-rufipedis]
MKSVALQADAATTTTTSVAFSASEPSPSIPIHPIESLQLAFTESLDEVTNGSIADKPKLARLDAHSRRAELLTQPRDASPPDALWRYRPGQTQHELFKLLAQMAFGVYLLLDGMANSNDQVIAILQSHIDDIDEYLEVTLQDVAQAAADINARIDHLKMPLSNLVAFEKLLEDRNFRRDILDANAKIDHVLCRTAVATRQWEDDVAAGTESTSAFTAWLADQDNAGWRAQRPDVADVFDAMRGNADGWLLAFQDVKRRVDDVNGLVGRLTTVIAEMEKKAGEVSRRTWSDHSEASAPASVPGLVDGSSDESSYVLQPRIYSPRIPGESTMTTMNKPASFGDGSRASLGSVLTDASNRRSGSSTPLPRPSSKYATPRSALLDSVYGSDDVHSRSGSVSPPVRPHMIHSPRSEQNQFYRPVRASPHSPLQQRPHTATGPPLQLQQAMLRKQPSQPSSLSTLATDGGREPTPRPDPQHQHQSHQPHQPLKKKKSAFGWLKQAFSLDDEEKAQFQARRAMAQPDRYYDANSPRFLDGRRIR